MDPSKFERLWATAAPYVRTFLAAACRDAILVDDLLQEVAMTVWQKRDQFDVERNFEAWAIGIARFALLRHRRDMARKKVILAPDLIEQLETLAIRGEDLAEDRRQALAKCISDLDESGKTLLNIRYEKRTPLADAAQQLGRSHGAIRTALARLRDTLKNCIQKRLKHSADI